MPLQTTTAAPTSVQFCDAGAQQLVGEVASKNSPDLRHLARRAKPDQARQREIAAVWRGMA